MLGVACSSSTESLGREIQQSIAGRVPIVCTVDVPLQVSTHNHVFFLCPCTAVVIVTDTQVARIEDTPLIRQPSQSPSPSSKPASNSGISLIFVIIAGIAGVSITAVAGLLIWRHRRRTKHLRRKVQLSNRDLQLCDRIHGMMCCSFL